MSEMLEKVRELKLNAVKAMTDFRADVPSERAIREFLFEHRYQILDMLDDALTAYENGTWNGKS
jgi:hypothetical protein